MENRKSPNQSRADRLVAIVERLRDGRLHRGADLAQHLGVSTRTIYRDMETLIASGVPVEGERGLGYMMTAPITLPPLNLSLAELEALHLGLSVVSRAGDKDLAQAADDLSRRIDAALPEDRTAPAARLGIAVYPFPGAAHGFVHMAPLRAAIRSRRLVRLTYTELSGDPTEEVVRPLQIEYWGRVWTLTAWCEGSATFRVFRVDRIATLDVTFDTFAEEPGKSLADYLASLDGE